MLFKIFTYICAVFLHWVSHFVILVAATFPRKEAFLAHIKVEAFQAAVSKKCILVKPDTGQGFRVTCHLKPWMGFCLQMLHLAWCRAVSAAVNLTGKEHYEFEYSCY